MGVRDIIVSDTSFTWEESTVLRWCLCHFVWHYLCPGICVAFYFSQNITAKKSEFTWSWSQLWKEFCFEPRKCPRNVKLKKTETACLKTTNCWSWGTQKTFSLRFPGIPLLPPPTSLPLKAFLLETLLPAEMPSLRKCWLSGNQLLFIKIISGVGAGEID